MGTDRVCGMDEFRVEVVNIAEEAERLNEAAKVAAKSKDHEEEEDAGVVPSIPCNIQVKNTLPNFNTDQEDQANAVPPTGFNRRARKHIFRTVSVYKRWAQTSGGPLLLHPCNVAPLAVHCR